MAYLLPTYPLSCDCFAQWFIALQYLWLSLDSSNAYASHSWKPQAFCSAVSFIWTTLLFLNPLDHSLFSQLMPITLFWTSTQIILCFQESLFNPPDWVSSSVFSKNCIFFPFKILFSVRNFTWFPMQIVPLGVIIAFNESSLILLGVLHLLWHSSFVHGCWW